MRFLYAHNRANIAIFSLLLHERTHENKDYNNMENEKEIKIELKPEVAKGCWARWMLSWV